MIACCSADLTWGSRIGQAAAGVGLDCRFARDPDALSRLFDAGPLCGMLVDLDLGEAAFALIAAGHGRLVSLPIIAFGPHVDREGLARAREAGADRVLARGALARRLEGVLRDLAARGAGGAGATGEEG
jgi:hypothetical protein